MREVAVTGATSPRLRAAAAALGLWLRPQRRRRAPAPPGAVVGAIVRDLLARRVVLIQGPSGSGKSTLLASVRRAAARRGLRLCAADHPRAEHALVADALGSSLDAAMSLLADAGLAEGALLARRVRELSVGQRHRLALAQALDRTRARSAIVADDFTATLDRATAHSVSAALARAARRRGVGALLATTHADLTPFLRPDVLVDAPLDAAPVRDLLVTVRCTEG